MLVILFPVMRGFHRDGISHPVFSSREAWRLHPEPRHIRPEHLQVHLASRCTLHAVVFDELLVLGWGLRGVCPPVGEDLSIIVTSRYVG